MYYIILYLHKHKSVSSPVALRENLRSLTTTTAIIIITNINNDIDQKDSGIYTKTNLTCNLGGFLRNGIMMLSTFRSQYLGPHHITPCKTLHTFLTHREKSHSEPKYV
uniref:Uncharacterized protein n=1 Tax=Octopus bimaculoides TaxID=37653 RepID=A0A0L8GRC8_OCTBM